MEEHTCQNCGTRIPAGDVYYNFSAKFISGFDNYIPDAKPETDPERLITEACKVILQRSEQELMDEVYEEISLLLCPGCRNKVRSYLLSLKKTVKTKSEKILPFPTKEKR
ncbi:MAG: hypothetical protein KQH63_11345 [Desulfobulbaceae bacterium]|nr:hypothetical protein [Desulfobulbaceae bacterium]